MLLQLCLTEHDGLKGDTHLSFQCFLFYWVFSDSRREVTNTGPTEKVSVEFLLVDPIRSNMKEKITGDEDHHGKCLRNIVRMYHEICGVAPKKQILRPSGHSMPLFQVD